MLDWKTFFLGLIFLLLPIAHLKWMPFRTPLYLAEIPLIMMLLIVLLNWRAYLHQVKKYYFSNTLLMLGIILFFLGVIISFSLNEKELTGLGMLKSFFFFPIFLAFSLLLFVRSLSSVQLLLWLWLAGLVGTAWVSLLIATQGWLTYDSRLAGLYVSPNHLAMLLAFGILLSYYFAITYKRKILRVGSIFFLFSIGVTLFLTQSYGVIFSTTVASTVFFLLIKREMIFSVWKIIGLILVIAASFFLMMVPTQKFQDLLSFDERSSLASRLMIWRSALHIARDSLPFGIGPGNFQKKYLEYQKYYPPYLEWAVPQPHNLLLALLLQTGVIGFVGFGLVCWSLIKGWYNRWRQIHLSREDTLVGALLFSLFVQIFLFGMIDTPYFKNDLTLVFWGLVGFLVLWIDGELRGQSDKVCRSCDQ